MIDKGSIKMTSYYEQLAAMPEEIRNIALELWDETGRPKYGVTATMALGRILDLSDDWDEFISKWKQLIPETDMEIMEIHDHLTTAWMCYVYGMGRIAKDFEKRNAGV